MLDISKTKIYISIEHYYGYILAVVFSVFVLSGFYWIVLPQYYSVQNTSQIVYNQSAAMLAERQQYLTDLQAMEAHYKTIDKNLLIYMHNILPEVVPEMTFAEIEAIIRQSKFSIQSINIAPLEAKSADATSLETSRLYSVTQVTVNISSTDTSYTNFKELMQTLENSAQLIELDTLSYNPQASDYTLTFKLYSL